MPPPDLPERKNPTPREDLPFAHSEDGELAEGLPEGVEEPEVRAAADDNRPAPNEIQPGSRDSVLLKNAGARQGRQIQERQLEGENVEVRRVQQPRRPMLRPELIIPDEPEEMTPPPSPPIQRPSPFGPPPEREEEKVEEPGSYTRPSPFGPPPAAEESASPPADDASENADEGSGRSGESAPEAQPDESPAQPLDPVSETSDDDNGETLADGEKVDNGEE